MSETKVAVVTERAPESGGRGGRLQVLGYDVIGGATAGQAARGG
jgi:hypothetical protein